MPSRAARQRIPAFVALFVLLAAAAFAVVHALRAEKYDAETFCPETGEYARTAILIDATDPLEESHIHNALREVEKFVTGRGGEKNNTIAPREWVGVFVLNENNLTAPSPTIALCNPGGKSECNSLFENCADAERAFQNDFVAPMTVAIRGLAATPPGNGSPILEMIRGLARADAFNRLQTERLIIVSDMLQNVPEYSHYGGGFEFAEWRETEYARDFLRPLLNGANVEIWYVKRPKFRHLQTNAHVEFWNQFFAAIGAQLTKVKPI